MKNKLVLIGNIGMKRIYINVSKEEAIKRFCETENMTQEQFERVDLESTIRIYKFDDEIPCYDIFEEEDVCEEIYVKQ